MSLQIPLRLLGTVIELFRLPDPERRAFLNAMLEVAPSIGSTNYEYQLRDKFPDYSPERVSSFVNFFLSFYNLIEVGEDPGTTAKDFVQALRNVDDKVIQSASEDKFSEFETFALQILDSHDSFGISAKATRLILENERTFVSSEIFSDIRSVFSDDALVKRPSAAFVIHSLKLHYQDSTEHKDFFIVLDYGDLLKLHESVERALDKHGVLADMISVFGLHNVEVGGFDE